MKFELWSFWHYVYILSPFLFTAAIYLPVRNKSQKTKDAVAVVLGIVNLLILLARNVDIYVRVGWDHEIIPLQVCHIGNIVVGLALLTKKKWLLITGFCFNLIPAFASIIFADSLVNYATLWAIRPQAYIWGHLAIIVGAIYGLLVYKPDFKKKDVILSVTVLTILLIAAIVYNSLFRELFDWRPNFFYIFDSDGTPFGFVYDLCPSVKFGWFEINILYTVFMIVLFIVEYFLMAVIAKLILKLPRKAKA